ncbi:MAG: ECF-type sigma factor [Terriglobales bacterium]
MATDSTPSRTVTQLLRAWGDGDQSALAELTPLVYEKLHSLARRHMSRENEGHTLQATALIHEVYLRLVEFPSTGSRRCRRFPRRLDLTASPGTSAIPR